LRQKGVDALLAVEDRTGEAQDRTSTWIQKLEKAQAKLQAIKDQKALQAFRKATAQPADATTVEPAEPTNRFPNKRFEGRPLPEGMDVGLPALKEAKKGVDSVSDINSLIKATREAFNTLNNKEARGFIGRLQRMRSKMQGLADATERLGQRTKQALAEGLLRIGDAFGRSVANAIANLDLIDGGLSRMQKIKKKLSTLQLQQRQRRLREQLGEATGIDAQVIRKQLSLVSAQLKKARKEASLFGKAFQSLKGIIGSVVKAVIKELTALVAKLAIVAVFKQVLGGPFGLFSGGASFVGGGLGGVTGGPSLAAVQPGGVAAAATPAQPTTREGGGEMQFRVRGQDLVAVQEATKRSNRNSSRRIEKT